MWLQLGDLKTLICHLDTEILSKIRVLCQVPVLVKLLRHNNPQENSLIYRFFSCIDKHPTGKMNLSGVNSPFVLLCKTVHFLALSIPIVLLLFNVQLDGCFQKQVQTFLNVRTSWANQHVVILFSQGCHKFHFWYNAWKEATINTPNCSKIRAALVLCLTRSYRVQNQQKFLLVHHCLLPALPYSRNTTYLAAKKTRTGIQ